MLQKIKNTLIYLALRSLLLAVNLLPYSLVAGAGEFLGGRFYAWVPKERERALRNLAQAYPEVPEATRTQWAARVFVSFGRSALELLKMFTWPARRITALVEAMEGMEHMRAARELGRGVLCLTAHLGNWEIIPLCTLQQGWPTGAVAQTLYDPRLDMLINRFREQRGLVMIKRQQMTRDIIRALRANLLLGILNDQDTGVDSRWAPFFGRPAKTPVGVFRLARKLGTPVVPVFIARQPNKKYRIYIEPALRLPRTADEEQDLREGARLANVVIEKYVRRFPDQWVWFHQRWKSPPPEEKEKFTAETQRTQREAPKN